MIHRGQILVRDCGASRKSYFSDAIGTEFRHDFAMVGIAEVDEHKYPEHQVRGILERPSASSFQFQTTDYHKPITGGRASDLGSLVLDNDWPRPDPMFGLGGGGILFRDSRMPAPAGRRISLVLIVASLPAGSLKNHHIYELEGDAGPSGAFSLANPVDAELPMGESLNSLLKLPLWGWGAEKVGFVSTMDLKTIDQCMRMDALTANENRTKEEDAELAELTRGEVGWIIKSPQSDETYQAYRREMLKARPNPRWDSVMTKAERDAESTLASSIIKRLLEDCPS